jgi:hypothetical protein
MAVFNEPRLMDIELVDREDRFRWGLYISRDFTMKSRYLDLLNGHTRFFVCIFGKLKDR